MCINVCMGVCLSMCLYQCVCPVGSISIVEHDAVFATDRCRRKAQSKRMGFGHPLHAPSLVAAALAAVMEAALAAAPAAAPAAVLEARTARREQLLRCLYARLSVFLPCVSRACMLSRVYIAMCCMLLFCCVFLFNVLVFVSLVCVVGSSCTLQHVRPLVDFYYQQQQHPVNVSANQ